MLHGRSSNSAVSVSGRRYLLPAAMHLNLKRREFRILKIRERYGVLDDSRKSGRKHSFNP